MDVSNETDLQEVLTGNNYSFIFDCGCTFQITMENRLEIVEAVWQHLTRFSISAELAQLQEGLRGVLNFGTLMNMHPAAIVKMLSAAHTATVTMDQLLDCFVPRYSDEGSNQKIAEETLMHNFSTLLEECEDGLMLFSCSDLLAFTTGSSAIPPLGLYPTPSIKFTPSVGLPTASTCSNVLRIPLHLTEYAQFKASFDLAVRGCQGFGTI